MKKLLGSIVLLGVLFGSPVLAHAQTVEPVTQDEIHAQLEALLVQLIAMVNQLQAQLAAQMAQQATQTADLQQKVESNTETLKKVEQNTTPSNTGASSQSVSVPESCSLSISESDNGTLTLSWTSTGFDEGIEGSLYFQSGSDAGEPIWTFIQPVKGSSGSVSSISKANNSFKLNLGDTNCYAKI